MKKFLIVLNIAIWSFVGFQVSAYAAERDERVRLYEVPTTKNDNCVKKDKKGNCPPVPNSPKPTPKKKVEEKK